MNRSKIAIGIASIGAAVAMAVLPAAAANADATSTCTVAAVSGQSCIYWGQAYNNSHSGVLEAVSNFPVSGSTSYKYLSSGTGAGEYIGNNNGSVANDDTQCTLFLWYNQNDSGPELTLSVYGTSGAKKAGSGLGSLLNNLRSQSWSC